MRFTDLVVADVTTLNYAKVLPSDPLARHTQSVMGGCAKQFGRLLDDISDERGLVGIEKEHIGVSRHLETLIALSIRIFAERGWLLDGH